MNADYARARRALMRRDPILASIIRKWGECRLAEAARPDHFSALVRSITFQQLSTGAASTIHGRFLALLPGGPPPTPAKIEGLSDADLRGAGFSRQKISYLRDLASKVGRGEVALEGIDALDDEQVVEALVKIRGIGRWSAEMFLMFRLLRPDVLPVDDLGIAKAMQRAYRLRQPPRPPRMREIAEPWRPYRSIACWYLWRSLENAPWD